MTKAQAGRMGGLMNRRESNPNAKLTAEIVATIRELRARGVRRSEVAAMFGIHPSHVSKVANRRRWA